MALSKRKISIIGLGYVGLPVAVAFGEAGFSVTGFDVSSERIEALKAGHDITFEVEKNRLHNPNLVYTDSEDDIRAADFHIVTVPTPVTDDLEPDISFLISASMTVGRQLKKNDIVVYESTVYPGCTEEDCLPVLEAASGLKAGRDFFIGYSPERINPGDITHRFETIQKVVAGQCPKTLEIIAETYRSVVIAGIYKAQSIKVAEAAKVIENTQRDLNIAFVNELSQIFRKMNIDTSDVLAAAGTKWNFIPFEPGLVGGHCIGVDPYYLTTKAKKVGAEPQIILSGRKTNDDYALFIAEECRRWCAAKGMAEPKIAQLGLTFKENIPDIRNSKAFNLMTALCGLTPSLSVFDQMAAVDTEQLGVPFNPVDKGDGFNVIVLAVPHRSYIEQGWTFVKELAAKEGPVLVMDVKARLDRDTLPDHIDLWRP